MDTRSSSGNPEKIHQGGPQVLTGHGFHQHGIDLSNSCLFERQVRAIPGHEDHRDRVACTSKNVSQFEPRKLRHALIRQNQMEGIGRHLEVPERFHGRCAGGDGKSQPPKPYGVRVTNVRIVINEQDSKRRGLGNGLGSGGVVVHEGKAVW